MDYTPTTEARLNGLREADDAAYTQLMTLPFRLDEAGMAEQLDMYEDQHGIQLDPRVPKCDQCQMAFISTGGMSANCHEHGCPNAGKTWNADEQRWVLFLKCSECGCDVEEGEVCDCQDEEPDQDGCNDPRCGLRYDHTGPCEEEEDEY